MAQKTIKLEDTDVSVSAQSRLDLYWLNAGFTDFYKKYRKGLPLPAKYQTVAQLDKIIKLFHLKAVGFGNYVTQEDRYNYVSAMIIALYDLDKVLGFKGNVGMNNTLSITFGSRGQGGALAHFESGTFIINLTRYSSDTGYTKEYRFANTGGAGAVAHEYGHAIDYYFGMKRDVSNTYVALSGGRSTRRLMEQKGGPFRLAMDNIINAIIWEKVGERHTNYYDRLLKNFDSEYYFRRNELFARAFEKYIQYKLSNLGILNSFLTTPKYEDALYLSDKEIAKIAPKIDILIKKMATVI